eukprot:m.21588 g.21588  ORF g.21588 m.21588 type:complete len:221 (+) comp7185_c0_seq1:215-877(+)
MSSKLIRAVMIGPPGCGKGTYAAMFAPRIGVPHVSTGDALRKIIKTNTALANEVAQFVHEGNPVPDNIMTSVLKETLSKSRGFILDGYPRTLEQALLLEQITPIDRVVHVTFRDDLLTRKICGRRVCSKCGISWNIEDINEDGIVMPPLLPEGPNCGPRCYEYFERRKDDEPSVIKNRLRQHHEHSKQLMAHYRNTVPVHDVEIIGGIAVMEDIFATAFS